MRWKSAVAALSLASVLVLTLPSFAPSANASTAMPTWTIGSYWEYNATSFDLATTASAWGTYRMEVVGTETIAVAGESYPCYKVAVNQTMTQTVSGASFTATQAGHMWYRTTDLALVEESIGVNVGSGTVTSTTTYAPPRPIHWPLTDGANWTATEQTMTVTSLGSITIRTWSNDTAQFTVGPDFPLFVPAGDFNVTPITERAPTGGFNVTDWSAAVGGWIRADAVGPSPGSESMMRLTSYSLAPPSGPSGSLLGLPVFAWAAIVAAVAVVAAVVILVRMRKPKAPPRWKPEP